MKVQKYIRNRGIEAILSECNYNLRAVKGHLKSKCDLPIDKDLTSVIKLFKEYLKESVDKVVSEKTQALEKILKEVENENLQTYS